MGAGEQGRTVQSSAEIQHSTSSVNSVHLPTPRYDEQNDDGGTYSRDAQRPSAMQDYELPVNSQLPVTSQHMVKTSEMFNRHDRE